ncbi:hypothetical protein V8G54_001420 [Vigna mungo]|uniref:Uncharacterized protein n=1 Tax=Vigna mungo TaxID=3915 RepID=A0AAQ3SBH3_VIGMU
MRNSLCQKESVNSVPLSQLKMDSVFLVEVPLPSCPVRSSLLLPPPRTFPHANLLYFLCSTLDPRLPPVTPLLILFCQQMEFIPLVTMTREDFACREAYYTCG